MRVKAIPQEAIAFVEHNPLYFVGGGAVAVVGYLYYQHVKATTTAAVTSDDTASTQGVTDALGYSAPIIYSNGTTDTSSDSGSAGTVSTAASQVGIDATTAAILAQKDTEDQYAYNEAMFGLSNQLTLGAASDIVTLAGLQSQNYATAAGLAETFITSGKLTADGTITGPDGGDISFNLVGLGTGSKDNSHLQEFLNGQAKSGNLPTSQGTYDATGQNTTTSYAGLLASALGIAGLSNGNSAGNASSSSSVGQSSTSAPQSIGVTSGIAAARLAGNSRVSLQ